MPRLRNVKGALKRIPDIIDLNVPVEYDLFKVGLTQSLIYKFYACPIQFLIGLNRYRKKDSTVKMGWGSLFHYLLDNLYSEFKRSSELIDSKKDIMDLIQVYYDENPDYCSGLSEEDMNRREIISYILLQQYIEFYSEQGEFDDFKVLYVEKEFEYQHEMAVLRGKFDCLLRNKDGSYWLLEHKTILRILEDYLETVLNFDFQSLFYIYCIERIYRYNVKGVQYNVVRNSSLKRHKQESWKGFTRRFRKEIVKKPKHFFKRFPHPYTKKAKISFEVDMEQTLIGIKRFIDDPIVYKRQTSCMRQYKCWDLDACANGRLLGYSQSSTYFSELGDK